MNPEELQRMIADGVAAALNQQREQDAAAAAAQAAFDAAVKTEVDKRLAGNPADRRLPSFEAPNVAQFGNIWKYDNLDETDLAIAIGVLKAARLTNRSEGPSENLLRALAVRLADMPDPDGQYIASKMAMKAAGMPVKANELNQSTLASYGDEWVGVTYSTQIWDKIRFEAPIVSKLPTVVIPQGSESIIIPLNSASPTFYKVAQASAMGSNPGQLTNVVTTSKMSTDKVTLTAGKMGAAVAYTGELEEDSLLPWASELRRDLTAEAAEVLEHLVIDGDVAPGATTNINHIGGTPGATDVYTLFDGFRKLALVTNTANSRDGGVLDVSDFLETVKLMGVSGINAIDRSKVSLLIDVNTHWWTLELPEVLTKDVFAMPTIESGALKSIWGYEVIPTANMHRASAVRFANTAGKVDQTTPGNNTKGSIVAVRWDRWRLGYKRRVTFEVERSAMADASTIVLMMRCGLLARDNEASAVSYNISKV
jgi:HK97 family phage major capsid protein